MKSLIDIYGILLVSIVSVQSLSAKECLVSGGGVYDATSDYRHTIACGDHASAEGESSTALGALSSSSGPSSTAIGSGAKSLGSRSVALGAARSNADYSIALGPYAKSNAPFSSAMGSHSEANGGLSIALGYSANSAGSRSISIGPRSFVSELASNGIAIGSDSKSTASGAIALGEGVENNTPNSMKIGVPLRIQSDTTGTGLLIEGTNLTTVVRNILKLKNNGGVGFQLEDSSNTNKWEFRTGGSGAFLISDVNVGGAKLLMNSTGLVNMGKNVAAGSNAWNFELDADGDLHIAGNMFVSGTQLTVPDYVFADDYKLMSLDELQSFVQKEKHLPNIASEAEVKKAKTVNIGQSQMKHLEKIEELTLYTLQQHQTIKGQQQQIKEQQQQVEALRLSVAENTKMKERVASLEKLVTNLASANGHLSLSGEKVATAK